MQTMKTTIWTGMALGMAAGVALAGGRAKRELGYSVAAVSASDMESAPLVAVDALLRRVPGLQVETGGDEGRATVFMRGLGQPTDGVQAGLGAGYNSDPSENGSDGRGFVNLDLAYAMQFGSGPFQLNAVLGLGLKQYEDDVWNADDDQLTYDWSLVVNAKREFSRSVAFEGLGIIHFGDHGTTGMGYVRPGLQWNETLDWKTQHNLHYRFDGLDLESEGWGYSTYYKTAGYAESGGDALDSYSFYIGQEVRNTLNDQTTVYVDGQYGMRRWDDWGVYDSDVFQLSGGVRTGGDGWDTDASLGWRWSDYDDLNESMDSFTAALNYNRALSDALGLTLSASYGVQELYANEGGADFVDPTGVMLGARLDYAASEKLDVALSFSMIDVDSEFTMNDYHRGAIALEGSYRLNDTLTIRPGILWSNRELGTGWEEDGYIATLRVFRDF